MSEYFISQRTVNNKPAFRGFVIKNIISNHVDLKELTELNNDFKSQLQIYCQKNKLKLDELKQSNEKETLNLKKKI